MTQTPTLAEALAADEERFAVSRDVLLGEYRRLLQVRPDVDLSIGGPGAWESALGVCPQIAETWHETLGPEDTVLLGRLAERLGFDKNTVRRHAIAIARYRRAKRKIAACGDVDRRLKAAETARDAAWRALLEADKIVGATIQEYDQALLKWRKVLGLNGDIILLQREFGEILPAE